MCYQDKLYQTKLLMNSAMTVCSPRHLERPGIIVEEEGGEGGEGGPTSDLHVHCLLLCPELQTLITEPQAREN